MMDNYLSITLSHFEAEYPDKHIEVSYLECIDCVIYGDQTKNKDVDMYIFVGFAEDSCIRENMFKAISYSTETKTPCIITFLESEYARATEMDYTVRPTFSTPCVHIMLTFDRLCNIIDTNSNYRDMVNEVIHYFKLPESCYVSNSLIYGITTFATVRVYTENKGKLTQRVFNY